MKKKPERPKFKRSEKLFLWCFACGAIVAGGAYWLWPGGHWGVYLGVAVVVTILLYPTLLETLSQERTLDRD